MQKTNIAYIIVAWNQPILLKRIVDRLNQDGIFFFIHIDRKNPDAHSFQQLFADYANVRVVSEFKVYWGGISQVKTALYMMKMAMATGIDFRYFVFLSGQDYPIKPAQYIRDFLSRHTCDFLSYVLIEHMPADFADKYRMLHYLDFKYINPKEPGRSRFLSWLYTGLRKRLKPVLPKRSFYHGYTPYFGSDWLALTGSSAQFILDFVAANPDYLRYMSFVEIPSELFFHNILLNSDRRYNVYLFAEYEQWLKTRQPGQFFSQPGATLRYMDWTDYGKNKSKPAVLDAAYYDVLKGDVNLFARKVDEKTSSALLDMIDEHILSAEK